MKRSFIDFKSSYDKAKQELEKFKNLNAQNNQNENETKQKYDSLKSKYKKFEELKKEADKKAA